MSSTFEDVVKSTQASESLGFSERLRRALDAAGVRPSPTLVAHEFNLRYWGKSITPHTARNWLIGKSIPMQDKLRVLADWLQVNPDALRFGRPMAAVGESVSNAEGLTLNLQDHEMLNRYLQLPPDGRKTARDVVTALWMSVSAQGRH